MFAGKNYMLYRNFNMKKENTYKNKVYYSKKKLEVYYMSGNRKKNITATILEKKVAL